MPLAAAMPSAMSTEPDAAATTTTLTTAPAPRSVCDSIDDLAMGLELKFLLLGLPLSLCHPLDEKTAEKPMTTTNGGRDQVFRQAYASLAKVIGGFSSPTRSGYTASREEEGCMADDMRPWPQPQAIGQFDIVEAGSQECEYWPTHWIIKKANSVERTVDDPLPDVRCTNGVAVPVEINSPKFSWPDARRNLPLVKEVLARLNRLPVCVNYTCDVHVHMGRYDGAPFSLLTLKKLASIFWLAEPVLRLVRDPRSPNYSNAYTWGSEQRRYSRLAIALQGRPYSRSSSISNDDSGKSFTKIMSSRNLCNEEEEEKNEEDKDWKQCMCGLGEAASQNEALRAIWRTMSSTELGLLLSGTRREYRRLGFNFSAFGEEDERARNNPRTIEFRILEGTLQDAMILGWLQICGKLVELGTKACHHRYWEVVRYLLGQQKVYDALLLGNVNEDGGDIPPDRLKRDDDHLDRQPVSHDLLFAELMNRIHVDPAAYSPLQEKVRRNYKRI